MVRWLNVLTLQPYCPKLIKICGTTVQCSALQYIAHHCSRVQFSAVQCSPVQCNKMSSSTKKKFNRKIALSSCLCCYSIAKWTEPVNILCSSISISVQCVCYFSVPPSLMSCREFYVTDWCNSPDIQYCTFHTQQCTLSTEQYTQNNAHYIWHTTHWTIHSTCYPLHIQTYPLYTILVHPYPTSPPVYLNPPLMDVA